MGAYALRPMSTGEILDGALTLLRRHFGLLCGLAIVCQGLPTALDVYLDLTGGSGRHQGLSLLDRLLTWRGSLLVRGGPIWVLSETELDRRRRGAGPGSTGDLGGAQRRGAAVDLPVDRVRLHALLLRPAHSQRGIRSGGSQPVSELLRYVHPLQR